MADMYGPDNEPKKYGKDFNKDPQFSKILSDTSIDEPVKISAVHKNINSLSNQLEKTQFNYHKQLKSTTSSVSSIVKEQQKIVKQINMKELASSNDIKKVEKSTQMILGKLGYTIDSLGKGAKKIVSVTAKTTKETLADYGRALSSDFYINKGNFLAMTLSKASPIFGYFAGKFMETGVFKNFAQKIKEKLGLAMTFVANKAKDLWGRGKAKVAGVFSRKKEVKSKAKSKEIPKLQTGGYVTKAGAAKLHAAEVVAPVTKLKTIMSQSNQGIVDSIQQSFKNDEKLLNQKFKELPLIIKVASEKALERIERNISVLTGYAKKYFFYRAAKSLYTMYRYFKRNKYIRELSKSQDPMKKMSEDIGLFYSSSMARLDDVKSRVIKKDKQEIQKQKILEKIKNAVQSTASDTTEIKKSNKKIFGRIGTWLMMGFNFLKAKLGSLLSFIGNKGVLGTLGSLVKLTGKGLSKIGTEIALVAVGIGKFSKWLIKLPFKALGKVFGFMIKRFPLISGIFEAITTAKDFFTGAFGKAREWFGKKKGEKVSISERLSAGLGAALGGTKSGIAGAKSGALKGLGLGMAVGSIVPGLGTAIGGALGAIAGGLLGAVGGKNIAKALQTSWKNIKSIVSSLWTLIKLPFKIMIILAKTAKKWWWEKAAEARDYIKEKVSSSITSLKEKVSGVITSINERIAIFLEPIFKVIDPVVIFMSDKITWLIGLVKKTFEKLMTPFNIVSDFLGKKEEQTKEKAKKAKEKVKDLWGKSKEMLRNAPKGISETTDLAEELSQKSREKQKAMVSNLETWALKKATGGPLYAHNSIEEALELEGIKNPKQKPNKELIKKMVDWTKAKEEAIVEKISSALSIPAKSGLVTSPYGPRNTGLTGASTFHRGIDLRAGMGEGINAVDKGVVSSIGDKWGSVSVKHPNGYTSSYVHLSKIGALPGQAIEKGQEIGKAGKTGPITGMAPHLHFAVRNPKGDFVDPIPVFKNAGINLNYKSGVKSKEVGGPIIKKGKEISKRSLNLTPNKSEVKNREVGGPIIKKGKEISKRAINISSPKTTIKNREVGGPVIKKGKEIAKRAINLTPKKSEVKNREVGGPTMTKKEVSRMESNKDILSSNLLNESAKSLKQAALDSFNESKKQTNIIVNNLSNNIVTSMNNLARSVVSSAGNNNLMNSQGNDEISAILSGRVS